MRPAIPADFPALLNIHIASIKSLTHTYQPQEIQAWVDYVEAEGPDRYAPLNSAVAEDDSGPQAFVSWSTQDDLGRVDCLHVLPEYGNQGISSELLTHAEQKLLGKNVQIRVTLNAQSFYEKHGYSFVEFTTSRAGFAIAIVEKHC